MHDDLAVLFTNQQRLLFTALASGRRTRGYLIDLLWTPKTLPISFSNSLSVLLWRMNKKLRPRGWQVKSNGHDGELTVYTLEEIVAIKKKSTCLYDPPSGWAFGFPKPYNPLPEELLRDTLIRDGYPKGLADQQHLVDHCRFIFVDDDETPTKHRSYR